MLKGNCIPGMRKSERYYKSSDKREMTIGELVIARGSEDHVPDHYLLRQRLVDLKMELGRKLKKSSMKVSIIVRKN
jgi:hypothetical protein